VQVVVFFQKLPHVGAPCSSRARLPTRRFFEKNLKTHTAPFATSTKRMLLSREHRPTPRACLLCILPTRRAGVSTAEAAATCRESAYRPPNRDPATSAEPQTTGFYPSNSPLFVHSFCTQCPIALQFLQRPHLPQHALFSLPLAGPSGERLQQQAVAERHVLALPALRQVQTNLARWPASSDSYFCAATHRGSAIALKCFRSPQRPTPSRALTAASRVDVFLPMSHSMLPASFPASPLSCRPQRIPLPRDPFQRAVAATGRGCQQVL
jgi:hypothetical protein